MMQKNLLMLMLMLMLTNVGRLLEIRFVVLEEVDLHMFSYLIFQFITITITIVRAR